MGLLAPYLFLCFNGQTMENRNQRVITVVMIILAVPAFYLIFNAGNPKSLLRFLVKDPSYDFMITVFFCIGIAVLGLVLTSEKQSKVLENMLETNADYIRKLRSKGKTDEFIAEDFLKTIGSRGKGVLFAVAKKKVLRYLSRLD